MSPLSDLKIDGIDRTPHGLIGFMKEFTKPEDLYDHLIEVIHKYHPSTNISRVEMAYKYALKSHGDQMRKSGEPYIIHPLSVAIVLAELEMDKETIMAGLLHDVLEDTDVTDQQMKEMFGEEVLLLVDGVTKLTQLKYSHDKVDVQAENLRKMFLAMAKDIRVIIIKLADRLHNMRTLQYQRAEKQVEIAKETIEIYSPIAQRLGISMIKTELDDLSLKYMHPEVYKALSEQINATKFEREAFISQVVGEIRERLDSASIKANVFGRAKHFFSIYRKMVNQDKTLDQIYDLFAVRIIVDDLKDCYAALGLMHEKYRPMPERFKDYIAMPKPNMYQSLHTTLIGPGGTPFEIQIRTNEMNRTAEFGIAAHWKYKEQQNGNNPDASEEEKLSWLREILEWQRDMDNSEFLSALKTDFNLFSDNVFAFTPNGEVITLPAGSNVIDFAYAIHSAVGNKMVGGKVNGKLVPIEYVIKNGDRIEILTSQNVKGPSRDWLKLVKSTKAKNKINQWFKTELKEDNIIRGREMLAVYCKNKGINLNELLHAEYMNPCMSRYGFKDWDSLLASIGHGSLKEGQVVSKLNEAFTKSEKKKNLANVEALLANYSTEDPVRKETKHSGAIIVKGIDDIAVHFGKCCAPVPGDEIVGFVTRGRGISIHRTDCVNMINLSDSDRQRLLEATWNEDQALKDDLVYNAEIRIFAENKPGVLLEITRVLSESMVNISTVTTRTAKNGLSTIIVGFEIKGIKQLDVVMAKLRQVQNVVDVERSKG